MGRVTFQVTILAKHRPSAVYKPHCVHAVDALDGIRVLMGPVWVRHIARLKRTDEGVHWIRGWGREKSRALISGNALG